MWFHSMFKSLTRSSRRRQKLALDGKQRARRLLLEGLEDRRVLAFDVAVHYPAGDFPQAVITADFNNDGRLDVATANSGSNTVSVLLGNADGSFQPAQSSATTPGNWSIAVGDFNADGNQDIATASGGDVNVLLGNGNGGFQAPSSIHLNLPASSVAVGDFNGDGKLDLAATTNDYLPPDGGFYSIPTSNGYANVLLGNGTGSFAAPIARYVGNGYFASAAVADFNGDGKHDLATVSSEMPFNLYDGIVSVILGNASGLGATTSYTTGGIAPGAVVVGDFTGDDILDLATAGILTGDGNGAFQLVSLGDSPTDLAPADFDGDGNLDLVWVDGDVSVRLGNSDGTFRQPIVVATEATGGVAVGDFNGDGRPDLTTANRYANGVAVLLNDGVWDTPFVSINDVTVTEGNTGNVSAEFTVRLSAAYDQPVTIYYATADGSATVAGGDYQVTSGLLTFAPGVTAQTVTVLVNGDRLGEGSEWSNESFFVNLSDPTNVFIADASGVGTILDDEPTISVASIGDWEGNSGVKLFDFIVTLSAAYDVPVTVEYATADLTLDEQYWYVSATAGVDYTATVGTLTIPAGQISGTIGVPVIGDRVGEANEGYHETFSVNLSNPSGARLISSKAFCTIFDDEPYVSIDSGLSVSEGDSGTTAMTFTVSQSVAYDVDVAVSYATLDGRALAGSDYVAAIGTVTIPAGQTSQVLSVLVNGDSLVEGDEYFTVNLTGTTHGTILNDWGYGTGYGTILDDDAAPTISIGDASVVEGSSGSRQMTFTVSLSQASSQSVRVNYKTANGTAKTGDNDYVSTSGTITFNPGQTSKTITISIKGDKKVESDERFFVNLSGASGAPIEDGQGEGWIVNDDAGSSSSKKSHAAAVDAVLQALMNPKSKKRGL